MGKCEMVFFYNMRVLCVLFGTAKMEYNGI